MSKIEHEKSCNYINLMYPTNPPQSVPCNCRLSRLVDEEELRGQIAKEIKSIGCVCDAELTRISGLRCLICKAETIAKGQK
jgi:hypothetical protein